MRAKLINNSKTTKYHIRYYTPILLLTIATLDGSN